MSTTRYAVLLAAGLVGACGGGSQNPQVPIEPRRTPVQQLALKTFAADCSDFLDYAADALTEQYLTPVYCLAIGPCPVFADAGPPPPGAPMATPVPTPGVIVSAPPPADAPEPERVSGTNTQEAGVDEADIVKVDAAGRLYILDDNRLLILPAFPPEGLAERPLAALALAADGAFFHAYDFFLDEDAQRAVVLGSSYDSAIQAVAVIVDVSDPTAPRELRRLVVDGSPLASRRVDGRVHRVSRFDVPAPAWFYDADDPLMALRDEYYEAQDRGDEDAAAAIKARIRAEIGNRVVAAGTDPYLPRLRIVEGGSLTSDTPLACDAISRPEVTTALGLAVVDSFDTDGGNSATGAIVNNAYIVYAARDNLYLAQSSWGWFFDPAQLEETAIYRLALSADGVAAYRALGKVDGSIDNSYQLSEFDGYLRIASTQTRQTDDGAFTPYNHVTVLDATASEVMNQVGALRDLAPTERIRGARFTGTRGFVVTFRQTDPLFAIDLSDPAAPKVASQLRIPGFSSYLMPLGDDYVLTIGRDGTDEQLTGGVAVQLFDVSDLSAVRQIDVEAPAAGDGSYSYSVAEYDPHAFSYFSDTEDAAVPGTLSVPLQSYSGDGQGFSGFLVLRVDPASPTPLAELGRIDHADLVDAENVCGPSGGSEPLPVPCGDAAYAADPRRSVFMQDAQGRYLYTVSAVGIKASDAAQPGTMYGSHKLP